MQAQYSQGAATSHHPSYAASEISGNGGSITSSLRQWRKKDYVEKQQSTDTSTSVAENTSHVARVAPHTYYPPRPANDVCHYQHQFSEYGDPYKPPAAAPVKYSEIVENQPQAIENINPVIQKHKEKEYVDFSPPQPHLKQYQELPLKPPYPDSIKQPYSDQYMVKESQMPPYIQKQSQMHQYMQKEPYQQFLSKYNMPNQYPSQSYPSEPNNFLAHLNKINPRMAQSIINDTHLRDSQIPMYHNLEQSRTYPQPQRLYHGPPMNSSPTHPHRNIPPQSYNYPPQPYNCSVKQGNDPFNRIQYQHNVPKYLPDYKMNSPIEPPIPNIPHQGLYNERLQMNYGPMSPNYPHCNQLEYAQHYQHRRSQIPPEYFSHPGYKPPPYMDNLHMGPDDNCSNPRGRKPSLKQYLETWVDEDMSGNLPDIIISNNMNEQNMENTIKSAVCVKSGDKQEQPLYVLDSTEIPDENLPHFLHLQQFEKLPDNIRGYYHSANSIPVGNRRIIVENDSVTCGTNQVRNDPKTRTEVPVDRIGIEGCAIGNQNKIIANSEVPGLLENPGQNLENKVVQIHIIEEPENSATSTVDTCSVPDTVIVKSNVYQQNLILNSEENCLIKQGQPLDNESSVKNMPVIDDGFNADCIGADSLPQSDDSSSNQSNSDEHSDDAFVNEEVGEDLRSGICSIYKEMENMQNININPLLRDNTNETFVNSNNCNANVNEDKREKCIPIQTDIDNEINGYLHSSSENIEFIENTSTRQETPPLTFESLTFPNSDVNSADSQIDAVNLSKHVECDELPKSNVNESEPENTILDQAAVTTPILESEVHGTSEDEPIKELDSIVEETHLTVSECQLDSPKEKECEDIETSNSEANTKDLVNENCGTADQSSDDDNSMPDIDKCVEQSPELNRSQPLENSLPTINIEETDENCDKAQSDELTNQTDIHETVEDFEKPPDLTNSKFGAETEKGIVVVKTEVPDEEEPVPLNLNMKDCESESYRGSNEVASVESSTNAEKEKRETALIVPIIKDKSHRKHRSSSDKTKNYKERREKSHSKNEKSSSKPEIRTEEPVNKPKARNEIKSVIKGKEKVETKQHKIKSSTKIRERSGTKPYKAKTSTTDSMQKSKVPTSVGKLDEPLQKPCTDSLQKTEIRVSLKTDTIQKESPIEKPSEVKPSKTIEHHPKIKDITSLTNNSDKEVLKTSVEGHSVTDTIRPVLEENGDDPDEPLTMIKVEQTYLEETYENANTNVVYQIADNNVVLQIADELLEINVTTQNGRKVIFVKTLTDAIILSNSDESVYDLDPEELRYERICEDVEILLNNNYITDARLSYNTEEEFSYPMKEICEESDVPVLAGDDVCVSNEEIVSSSTAELEHERKCEENPEKKPVKPKKVVTWEDEKLKNSDSDKSSKSSNDTQEQQIPPKRPKTKAALKYLETADELALKQKQLVNPSSEKSVDKPPKTKAKKSKSEKSKELNKSSSIPETKKPPDAKNSQNTEDTIKTIEKSTKNKKRKTLSPLKNTAKKKQSLPVKIKKEKIETHVLKAKINKDKVESPSPKIVKECSEEDSTLNNVTKLQEEANVTVSVLFADVIQPVPEEISKKCEEVIESASVSDTAENQISVQENSITSSTSSQESELTPKPNECKLAQQISEEWEDDSDEIVKAPPPPATTKKRLSLEEYNNRKRTNCNVEVASQQSDLTNNLLDNINYNCITNKRELSPESPVLSVNFNNKTYSRNSSSSSTKSPNQYDSLTNSIELQLPKLNRSPPKPVYSQEYLQNALRNDLHTVNAFTASLIKENQQLMQRFLNQQRLTLDELKKVKQIIRYKRLIQQLTTLKITGLNSSAKQDHFSIRQNMLKPSYQLNLYDLDKGHSSATKVTMEDPLKFFGCAPEKRKRKRFRFLYSDKESILNRSEKLPGSVIEDGKDYSITKRLRLDEPVDPSQTKETGGGYSVFQGASDSQLTLVFKRSFKNDPKMQPYVKLERLFSIDQLAKNRFY